MSQNYFEQIKKVDKNGNVFWYARELARILNYSDFRNFENAIEKAKIAIKNLGQNVKDHIGDATESIQSGKDTVRDFPSYKLSRYACYLIAQNGDPRKVEIAKAQTYFAVKTREREVDEQLMEDQSRVYLRDEVRIHNKNLISTASKAGVKNFGNFQDAGYQGLYGGLRQKEIKKRKGLKDDEQLLDNIGGEELGANLFRITQANAKIQREGIVGEGNANIAHRIVGEKVRGYVKDLGGTMPEDLPKFENVKVAKKRLKSTKKEIREIKKTIKKKNIKLISGKK